MKFDAKKCRFQPGRKYDDKTCSKVLEYFSYGWTIAQVAAALGIVRSTYDAWKAQIPEFGEAARYGEMLAMGAEETIGKEGTEGEIKGFDGGTYRFRMQARFRKEYGNVEAPISPESFAEAFKNLLDEKRAEHEKDA